MKPCEPNQFPETPTALPTSSFSLLIKSSVKSFTLILMCEHLSAAVNLRSLHDTVLNFECLVTFKTQNNIHVAEVTECVESHALRCGQIRENLSQWEMLAQSGTSSFPSVWKGLLVLLITNLSLNSAN